MKKDVYTYLMYDGRAYKIGKSSNINLRLKHIKGNNPWIELICFGNRNIEKQLHLMFTSKLITGTVEWFNLTTNEVEIIKSLINGLSEIPKEFINTSKVRYKIWCQNNTKNIKTKNKTYQISNSEILKIKRKENYQSNKEKIKKQNLERYYINKQKKP